MAWGEAIFVNLDMIIYKVIGWCRTDVMCSILGFLPPFSQKN